MAAPVNITIPVFNEQKALARSVNALKAFLLGNIDLDCEIVIANNGSTDGTLAIAKELERTFPNIYVLDIPDKGRGRALKQSWHSSSAEVLTYMDCDLSTDLAFFGPLVTPLLEGSYDIAAGSRLLPQSSTMRGFKRSIISRSYNALLRAVFSTHFSDAQCGFKAITKKAFEELLPLIEDDCWFMDTELLVIAQKLGYRIHDLPVRWTDDPDSKVKIFRTAIHDLKGILRVRRSLASQLFSHRKRT